MSEEMIVIEVMVLFVMSERPRCGGAEEMVVFLDVFDV